MVSKILVLELWGIGDIVFASGVLRVLKKSFPYSEVTLLAKKHAESVLLNDKSVDKFIVYDFPWTKFKRKYCLWEWDWFGIIRLIRQLRAEKFDLVFDARGDIRNNLLSFLVGAKRRIGYDWSGGGYFLTDIVKCSYKKLHRVDAWFNLLKHINIKDNVVDPVLAISKEEEKWGDEFLKSKEVNREKLLIGIHPGARIKTRCWPLERFSKVAYYLKQRNIQIIVFVEPDGYGQDMSVPEGCIKAKVNLREFIVLARKLGFLVCNDGGAMHLAVAVHTPVVAVFGPTDPVRFGPCGGGNAIVIKEDVPCRPCFDYCRHREPYCLTSITEEQVIKQVDAMIVRIRKINND